MNNSVSAGRSTRLGTYCGTMLSVALLMISQEAQAICGLDGVVREQVRSVRDPLALRALSMKSHLHSSCSACHLARDGGPRNEYGNAVNALLTILDREDPVRQREVGRRMMTILANPSLPNSPTFDELFQQGRFPANSLANQEPPLPEVAARAVQRVTAPQAREFVQATEAESRFGILQLSQTTEITREVAEVLAEFRGDTLILGIRTISPEVATALAKSRAANVWLHSVTSVSPEVADAISKLPGNLLLTGLTTLDSVPLAEKLATRPGAVSFPFLNSITPEIAAALAKSKRSLTLAGLTKISPQVEQELAQTVGTLSLPNLTSFDNLPLAKKMAAAVVLLPHVEKLAVEQLELLLGVKGQESFWGGVNLPLAAITTDIAAVLAANPKPINLTLVGYAELSDDVLRTLLKSRLNVTLQDVEMFTDGQVRIMSEAFARPVFQAGVLQSPRLSLPKLRKLDSPILTEALARSSGLNFHGVKEISLAAAAALGAMPDAVYKRQDGTVQTRPSGELNFPSLEQLSPETARLLLSKRWLSISLPSLQDVSLETVRLIASQTFRLNLGIPALPPEFADAFSATSTDTNMGGGFILLPNVTDLSPEAARILVKSLNRGVEDLGYTRLSKSPKLYFGGDFGFPSGGFPKLSPEVAVELAKYEGILAFQGLGELPDESAAALASFPGPYLILSGPGVEKLSPAAAASLAQVPGVLQIQLRELDSVPLAERFARQINWTLYDLETVSKEAAPALSQYKQFFNIRALTILDSPDMARRFAEGLTGGNSVSLPALSRLSPAASEILSSSSKSLYLGLTVIDSPAVATALAKSESRLSLPRLRAATPEVIEILKLSESDIYILSEDLRD